MEEAFPPWGKRERGYVNAGETGKGVCECRGKRERGYVNAGETGKGVCECRGIGRGRGYINKKGGTLIKE